jgi:predicted PurR-regulated permease PerM
MDNTWFEVLVVILSVMLAIFLVVAIVLFVFILKVTRQIKRITEHAEQIADKADQLSGFFAKTATPVALMKLVSNISESFQNKARKHKKGK